MDITSDFKNHKIRLHDNSYFIGREVQITKKNIIGISSTIEGVVVGNKGGTLLSVFNANRGKMYQVKSLMAQVMPILSTHFILKAIFISQKYKAQLKN